MRALLLALLAVVATGANAQALPQSVYQNAIPTPGWAGTVGNWRMPAANGSMAVPWRVAGAAAVVGGRSVQMTAAFRIAATAGATVARAMIGPGAIAAVAVGWAFDHCVEIQGGKLVFTCGPGGKPGDYQGAPAGGPFTDADVQACAASYNPSYGHSPQQGQPLATCSAQMVYCDVGQDCNALSGGYNNGTPPGADWQVRCDNCQAYNGPPPSQGHYVYKDEFVAGPRPTNAPSGIAATPAEVADRLAAATVPDAILRALPDGVPVELPILNPTAGDAPLPGALKIPVGAPVPVPNTNPQSYEQGYALITPSPTNGEPFRVGVQPGTDTGTDPAGMPEDATRVVPAPAPKPVTDPVPPPDICKDHPDSSACAKLDVPATPPLPTTEINVSVAPDTGWGADNGTCPAQVYTHLVGNVDVYQLFCKYLQGIRFLVIGFAWLMGTLIFIGRVE